MIDLKPGLSAGFEAYRRSNRSGKRPFPAFGRIMQSSRAEQGRALRLISLIGQCLIILLYIRNNTGLSRPRAGRRGRSMTFLSRKSENLTQPTRSLITTFLQLLSNLIILLSSTEACVYFRNFYCKMFYEGSLQSGIALALQESKAVVCFVRDDGDASKRYEDEYLKDPQITLALSAKAVTLRLDAESQEAGFLAAYYPIRTVPTLMIIRCS